MGCAQGKPSQGSPARSDGRGIDHLMRQNRYVPASSRISDPLPTAAPAAVRLLQEQQDATRARPHDVSGATERDSGNDRRSTEATDEDPAAAAAAVDEATPPPPPPQPAPRREEELVDGWPTWLLDNVPREALQGIVPKSADAYDKIAKACTHRTATPWPPASLATYPTAKTQSL
ncbi:hypothetical protein E2562_011999 [Oryza meyeriana var. granulata]|uniref:Uncharacterized protein n=1 Tax=Oryza meyeriana var. granulata TaxID=110450 RepID=A0A6G1F763_9ORYZ|nr:hypothetical protein E2562_011999 [Oryza meyeriana var. granulata]